MLAPIKLKVHKTRLACNDLNQPYLSTSFLHFAKETGARTGDESNKSAPSVTVAARLIPMQKPKALAKALA